jgi:hypothetical protein
MEYAQACIAILCITNRSTFKPLICNQIQIHDKILGVDLSCMDGFR